MADIRKEINAWETFCVQKEFELGSLAELAQDCLGFVNVSPGILLVESTSLQP